MPSLPADVDVSHKLKHPVGRHLDHLDEPKDVVPEPKQ